MSAHLLAPLVVLLGVPFMPGAARPPADDPADPLPNGAKVLFGPARLAARAWAVPVPPDYARLLAPDGAGGVRAFDLATGRPVGAAAKPAAEPGGDLPAPTGGVLAVSADGKRAVVPHPEGLAVRDVATGEVVATLRPTGAVSPPAGGPAVSLSADGAVLAWGGSGARGRAAVQVWDVAKAEVVARLDPAPQTGALPVLSPDGKLVAVRPSLYTAELAPQPVGRPGPADPGPAVTVWEVAGGKELFKARVGNAGPQTGVAFSPDGKLLAAGSGDGPVDLWEVPSGKPVRTLFGRTGQGARVAFSADGRELAAVAADGTIQRWTLPDGKPVGTTDPPADLPPVQPAGVGFAPGGRVVAWGTAGAAAVVWEAPSGKLLTPPGEHLGAVRSLAFGAGGKELVTAGTDGRVVRWDLATGKPLGRVALRLPRGTTLTSLGPRGPLVLGADARRAVSTGQPAAVFDLATGAELFAVPRGPAQRFTTHQFPSAELSRVAVLSVPFDFRLTGKCTVWDLNDQRKLAEFDLPASGGSAPAASLSPDGTRLVTVAQSRDPTMGRQVTLVTGWDLATGKKLGEVEEPNTYVASAVAAADNRAAVVAAGGRLWAVDYEAGRRGDDLEGGPGRGASAGEAAAFNPAGDRLAVGVNDPAAGGFGVRVYDWPRGRVLGTFTGHGGPVTAVAFTPYGKGLVSGSADTTAILWDLGAIPAGR